MWGPALMPQHSLWVDARLHNLKQPGSRTMLYDNAVQVRSRGGSGAKQAGGPRPKGLQG